jgi:hypothetical protein
VDKFGEIIRYSLLGNGDVFNQTFVNLSKRNMQDKDPTKFIINAMQKEV